MANTQKRLGYAGLVFISVAVLLGAVFLLDRAGKLGRFDAFDFWPSILVLLGIIKVALPLPIHSKITGGLFIAAGALLQLAMFQIVPIDLKTAWLVFIVVALVNMISVYVFRYVRGNRISIDMPGGISERLESQEGKSSGDAADRRDD